MYIHESDRPIIMQETPELERTTCMAVSYTHLTLPTILRV